LLLAPFERRRGAALALDAIRRRGEEVRITLGGAREVVEARCRTGARDLLGQRRARVERRCLHRARGLREPAAGGQRGRAGRIDRLLLLLPACGEAEGQGHEPAHTPL
jgi:hypothetical protein